MSTGTTPSLEPTASTALEDELAAVAQNIACPECGDTAVDLVEILSPDEATDESVAAFKGGLTGALVGGVAGAVFGPAGIGIGMAGGAIAGSDVERTGAKKERLVVTCPSCGHHGRAN